MSTWNPNDQDRKKDMLAVPQKGIVIDNKDPQQLRRIKVKVQGIMEGEVETLPWVSPLGGGSPRGNRGDSGDFMIPEMHTIVYVEFPTRDMYNAFYRAAVDDITDTTLQQVFGEDYPNTYGWMDNTGSMERTNKTQRYNEYLHNSSFYTRVDKEGNFHVYVPKNFVLHVGKDFHIKVDGNTGWHIAKDLGINIGSNYGIKAGGTYGEESGGTMSAEAPAIHHNSGITFGTANTQSSAVDSSATTVDNEVKTIVKMKEIALKKGEAIKKSLILRLKALIGTSRS